MNTIKLIVATLMSYVFIINVDQANDVFLFIVVLQFCLFLVQYPFACQETVPLKAHGIWVNGSKADHSTDEKLWHLNEFLPWVNSYWVQRGLMVQHSLYGMLICTKPLISLVNILESMFY